MSTSFFITIFTDAINLFNKKHANNSNLGIGISFTGASLHLLVHNFRAHKQHEQKHMHHNPPPSYQKTRVSLLRVLDNIKHVLEH